MATSPKRVYWDACTWIALIIGEKIQEGTARGEDRGALCRAAVIAQAHKNNIEIATSSLSLVEVCKGRGVKQSITEDKIASYFETDYILLVNLDRLVGVNARRLMMAGHAGLKPPDAIHVATAAIANADEMHTFDDALLALDGKVVKRDGTMLRI